MNDDLHTTVAFTGHRTYSGEAQELLRRTVGELYERGFRTFLSGMAVGFDLAAAETVCACRDALPGLRLVAAVPFEGQQKSYSRADRERFVQVLAAADETVVLSPEYHRGVYTRRNDFLVSRAALVAAWYDGAPGGTRYTVCRALRLGREVVNLCAAAPALPLPAPTLF